MRQVSIDDHRKPSAIVLPPVDHENCQVGLVEARFPERPEKVDFSPCLASRVQKQLDVEKRDKERLRVIIQVDQVHFARFVRDPFPSVIVFC